MPLTFTLDRYEVPFIFHAVLIHHLKALITLLSNPPVSTHIRTAIGALEGLIEEVKVVEHAVSTVTQQPKYKPRFSEFTPEQVQQAASIVFATSNDLTEEDTLISDEDFRHEEYVVLRESVEEDLLSIRQANLQEYEQEVSQYFSRIMLIEKTT